MRINRSFVVTTLVFIQFIGYSCKTVPVSGRRQVALLPGWEFNIIENDVANEWAMPGGKIVFYSGILPITKTEAGVAVVMGYEIFSCL